MQNLFNNKTRTFALLAGLISVSACAPESGVGTFWREAGAQVETGDFGRATLHNQLVQTCKSNGTGYAKGGKAGGHVGDAVVVLDPESTFNRKVYRVHCDGRLDGKYASFIYSEYVQSATQVPNVREASSE